MKNKVTFEELKGAKPNFPGYLLNIELNSINAAFEAVTGASDSLTKEDFLKVVTSDYSVVHFMGEAYLAAREEEKSELAEHAFYLFDELLNKQTELA